MPKLFGTDGIRGIANEFLSCELCVSIGKSLGHVLLETKRTPKVIIGMDTRASSLMLADAVSAGLLSVGCDVSLLGVISTPAVAHLVKKYGADAGIMISASHNSFEYNGIKIFNSEGFKLSDALEERIELLVTEKADEIEFAPGGRIGRKEYCESALKDYTEYLLNLASGSLDGIRVAIDAANGAAYKSAEKVFRALGAEVKMLAANPNGTNINENCGSTHLESLKQYVTENRFDVGIAFDGDADRCLAVDEFGREVDGDVIMAILARDMKAEGRLNKNTVVGTVLSNLGLQKFCEENGIKFVASSVGDRYVLEIMNREGYSLGGEQSGHVIISEHATTGDGQLTALMLLTRIKESKKSLSELSEIMKKYPQYSVNISATQNQKNALSSDEKIRGAINDAKARLGEYGRLVVRPSGTEPVIRIMTECRDADMAKSVADELLQKIRYRLEKY